ncbi:MAG TPA: amylo-alpha-1,6-glucosidase, partial [Chroococcales cyanobacterium]
QKDFWDSQKSSIAIALDGEGKRCDVVSSNPGHLLATGILTEEQCKAVADHLMSKEMFCGWGVRTLSALEQNYNPLSYHNGSVWPHDNALIAEGLSSLDRKEDAATILGAMLEVAKRTEDERLPELFCGFSKQYSPDPIWYPVSCSPQAWAAASPFLMLNSMLGIQADLPRRRIKISHPYLPSWLGFVDIKDMHLGKSKVDLHFVRTGNVTTCTVLDKIGDIMVIVDQGDSPLPQ